MTDLRKAAEMALEALERGTTGLAIRAIPALRQALAQPERKWVSLTDDEIDYLEDAIDPAMYRVFARRIEAKLKEKNGDRR